MNRVKEVQRINKKDLELQLQADTVGQAGKWDVNKSWHAQYKDSAFVYVGGLPYELTEGDVTTVFSQFGEVVDILIPRDKKTGKPKGFAFIAYEDQRSTVLAVDNFNGAKLLGRTLRCDHCQDFREEQKKNPDELPEHLLRKLSEKELEKKKQEITERNTELELATKAKEDVFAVGRGTHLDEDEVAEMQIRRQILDSKNREAQSKRTRHIEEVLQRRKAEAQADMSEEARKQAAWEERKRKRDEERQAAAIAQGALKNREIRNDPLAVEHRGGDSRGVQPAESSSTAAAGNSKWDRLMGGGGANKKKKAKSAGSLSFKQAAPAPSERKRTGEDSVSVAETNRMRAELGMAPLK